MDGLIKELERRQKITISKLGPDFLATLCDYIGLLLLNKDTQEVLQKEREQTNLPKNVWKEYNQLCTVVYDPIIKGAGMKKSFYEFYILDESDWKAPWFTWAFMWVCPPWATALWKRRKFIKWLNLVHERMLVLLKNKEYSPQPETPQLSQSSFIKLRNDLGITPDTKWQDITIRFKNMQDMEISHKDNSCNSNPQDLDFIDKRSGKPILSWAMLRALTLNPKHPGTFPMDRLPDFERQKWISAKKDLKDQLQTIFGLSSDPFEPYNKDLKNYTIKLHLKPENDELMIGMHRQLDEEYQDSQEY